MRLTNTEGNLGDLRKVAISWCRSRLYLFLLFGRSRLRFIGLLTAGGKEGSSCEEECKRRGFDADILHKNTD